MNGYEAYLVLCEAAGLINEADAVPFALGAIAGGGAGYAAGSLGVAKAKRNTRKALEEYERAKGKDERDTAKLKYDKAIRDEDNARRTRRALAAGGAIATGAALDINKGMRQDNIRGYHDTIFC